MYEIAKEFFFPQWAEIGSTYILRYMKLQLVFIQFYWPFVAQ